MLINKAKTTYCGSRRNRRHRDEGPPEEATSPPVALGGPACRRQAPSSPLHVSFVEVAHVRALRTRRRWRRTRRRTRRQRGRQTQTRTGLPELPLPPLVPPPLEWIPTFPIKIKVDIKTKMDASIHMLNQLIRREGHPGGCLESHLTYLHVGLH